MGGCNNISTKILGPRQIDLEVVRKRLMEICKVGLGSRAGKMIAHHCNECEVYSVICSSYYFPHATLF